MTTKPRALTTLIALLAVLALFAAACGSDSESSDDTSTEAEAEEPEEEAAEEDATEEAVEEEATEEAAEPEEEAPAEDVELTASFRGVTEDTITVGISMLDFEAMVSSGLSPAGRGDQEGVWQTFIDELNDRGGINGRMLEAIYSPYNPVITAEAESSCVELTEDNETFAVLGGYLGPVEDTNTCVTGVGETILVGGRITDERLEQSVAPWVMTPATRERSLDILLELLDQDGRIEGRDIAVVGSVELAKIADRAPALLEEYGANDVLVIENDIPQGEIQAENEAWQIYAEAIRAAGSEAVLLVGSGQSGVRGISQNGLDVEVWVVDSDDITNLGANTAPEDADGAITVAGQTEQETWDDPTMEPCREIFAAAYPDVEIVDPEDRTDDDEEWWWSVARYCTWLKLFEIVATEAGADLTQESFAAVIESLGPIDLPGIPFASLGPDKFDANDSFRLMQFNASVGESGGLEPITDLMNAAAS